MTKRQRSVLYITDWRDERRLRGIARYAREAGWHLALESHFMSEIPWGLKGDGCLTSIVHEELVGFCKSLNAPVVDMSYAFPDPGMAHVYLDDAAAGALAAEYFLNRGFRRFAFYGPLPDPMGWTRFASRTSCTWCASMRRRGLFGRRGQGRPHEGAVGLRPASRQAG